LYPNVASPYLNVGGCSGRLASSSRPIIRIGLFCDGFGHSLIRQVHPAWLLDQDGVKHASENAMTEKGTSLAELIIVMGIVGLATAVGAQCLLAAVARSQRQSATAEFAVELRAAHRLAIAQRKPVRAVVEMDAGILRLEPADESATVLRRYDFSARGIRSIQLSRGGSILFYPSGRSATPVTVTLIMMRGEAAKITVSITGKVTWS
jgi:Tfp pilus assembly protein FimT